MAIYLPSSAEEEQLALDELTPREIVVELDKHVIGQKDAKRAVAIPPRNRPSPPQTPPPRDRGRTRQTRHRTKRRQTRRCHRPPQPHPPPKTPPRVGGR